MKMPPRLPNPLSINLILQRSPGLTYTRVFTGLVTELTRNSMVKF
ncbi:hypothetical protein [Petrimonas sp.]|nr:hypothetical protein [Petrimonas sp.]